MFEPRLFAVKDVITVILRLTKTLKLSRGIDLSINCIEGIRSATAVMPNGNIGENISICFVTNVQVPASPPNFNQARLGCCDERLLEPSHASQRPKVLFSIIWSYLRAVEAIDKALVRRVKHLDGE